MNNSKLRLHFYRNINNKSLIEDFFYSLDKKVRAKILVYINMLISQGGRLKFPYARHMEDKIWELRVDFDKNFYRIFYFIFDGEKIILLHGFNKKTNKTSSKEISKAKNYYKDYLINLNDQSYEL
ncbi:MAG: type II toxin-antitoxin system RelE/ParE family toxin [Candidatus Falkowbacteria bacterium]